MEIIKKDGSSIELIRFFEYQGKNLLIFDNGEGIDANGHVIIHICNIDMNNGVVATAVQDGDMEFVRNIIKTIVNENRNGMPLSIKDLNYNDLNGITILSDWPLKMLPNYIDIIKMNQPIFESLANPTPINEQFNPVDNSNLNEQLIDHSNDTMQYDLENNSDVNSLNEINFNQFQNIQTSQSTFNDDSNGNQSINNISTEKHDDQIAEPNGANNMINDYEQMYFEQLNLVNSLNAELEMYKSKFEQLKNIIENLNCTP